MEQSHYRSRRQDIVNNITLIVVLVGLYFTTSVNYLLFHSLAEIFSIVVA